MGEIFLFHYLFCSDKPDPIFLTLRMWIYDQALEYRSLSHKFVSHLLCDKEEMVAPYT